MMGEEGHGDTKGAPKGCVSRSVAGLNAFALRNFKSRQGTIGKPSKALGWLGSPELALPLLPVANRLQTGKVNTQSTGTVQGCPKV